MAKPEDPHYDTEAARAAIDEIDETLAVARRVVGRGFANGGAHVESAPTMLECVKALRVDVATLAHVVTGEPVTTIVRDDMRAPSPIDALPVAIAEANLEKAAQEHVWYGAIHAGKGRDAWRELLDAALAYAAAVVGPPRCLRNCEGPLEQPDESDA